jgi:hypothetical protein
VKAPSVNFMMLPLWTRVSDLRLLAMAYWIAEADAAARNPRLRDGLDADADGGGLLGAEADLVELLGEVGLA